MPTKCTLTPVFTCSRHSTFWSALRALTSLWKLLKEYIVRAKPRCTLKLPLYILLVVPTDPPWQLSYMSLYETKLLPTCCLVSGAIKMMSWVILCCQWKKVCCRLICGASALCRWVWQCHCNSLCHRVVWWGFLYHGCCIFKVMSSVVQNHCALYEKYH